MNNLILNRDLTPADVPTLCASELELDEAGGGHGAAWAEIWRFALSFDREAYAAATGIALPTEGLIARAHARRTHLGSVSCVELRATLAALYQTTGGDVSGGDARLVDAILDALYAHLSGGAARPHTEAPLPEPGLGVFGAPHGSGQVRFWFRLREPLSRTQLYDRVAGILLREVDTRLVVSALYLYPPNYLGGDPNRPPQHAFMLLLQQRAASAAQGLFDDTGADDDFEFLQREYDRLSRTAVAELADRSFDHTPRLDEQD